MHGEILSFEVEPDGEHVIMPVSDPGEGGHITVRASKVQLVAMTAARPAEIAGVMGADRDETSGGSAGWEC